MAVTTLVLKNSKNRDERHATLLEAVRKQLDNPNVAIKYSNKGKPLLVGSNKHISVTTTGDVMVCAIADTNIGIDGENLARFTGQEQHDYASSQKRRRIMSATAKTTAPVSSRCGYAKRHSANSPERVLSILRTFR